MGTEHTPGPWEIAYVGDIEKPAVISGGVSLLTVADEDGTEFGAVWKEADARLIAAAPELLEVCEAALESLISQYDGGIGFERDRLENAIAKAKGKLK